ncbi:hypothetical protein EDC04DRAFT_2615955 [Pisolithus marmoratus]|nr:hypothetical protein EDC04DRAFT_2615955 [Pisolithus marmoratus]
MAWKVSSCLQCANLCQRCMRKSFQVAGLNVRGCIPHVLNTALEEYHTEATLWYLEVIFDFGTPHKLHHWQSEAQCLAAAIGEDTFQQKILFISVHSKVTHGDLFAGKDEEESDVAVMPKEFMDYLFTRCLCPLVIGATIFMLLCGPLVRLRPVYTVTFSAKCFISAVIKSFIVAFSIWVVIQGHNLGEVFKDLLDVSIELPMHTDAYLFQVNEEAASSAPHPSSSTFYPSPPMGKPPPNELPTLQLHPFMVTIQER